MGDLVQNSVVGSLAATFVVAAFLVLITEVNDDQGYNAGIDDINLTKLDKLQEFSDQTSQLKDQAIDESDVKTQESEVDLIRNAFTVGKFIFSGDFIFLMKDIMASFLSIAGLDKIVYTFLSAVLIALLSLAVLKRVTGGGS